VQLLQRILFGKDGPKSSGLDAKVNVKSPDFIPQFVPLPSAQTKNDDKNYFENKSFMQSMRRHSMDSVFFCMAEGRGRLFLFFPLFPNVFPSCSHGVPQVPKLFPKTFPIAPQLYPIWFAQSPTLMIQTEKDGPWKSIFISIWQLRVQRGASVGRGVPNVSKKW
jgi:hypothetical protein